VSDRAGAVSDRIARDPKSAGALVLFSGGQDSATCLAWALDKFSHVETLGFDYGQRHGVELEQRATIRMKLAVMNPKWCARLSHDHTVKIDTFALANSSLTGGARNRVDGLPNTFVPGRNLLFFIYAAVIAERRGLKRIVGGMCETDYSGYPDCRDDTLKALQATLNLGMQTRFVIDTPLMWLDKAQTWHLAAALGGEDLVEAILEHSHTCYAGNRSERHEWGYGCAECAACDLRAKGWSRFCADLAS
jgi:7-cyano-7-deazaguanine synthase